MPGGNAFNNDDLEAEQYRLSQTQLTSRVAI
jgi:hypothetical protein